jgi:hypothetical protein
MLKTGMGFAYKLELEKKNTNIMKKPVKNVKN